MHCSTTDLGFETVKRDKALNRKVGCIIHFSATIDLPTGSAERFPVVLKRSCTESQKAANMSKLTSIFSFHKHKFTVDQKANGEE